MRTSLLMLLWLAAISPVAHAADWLSWRKVGDASLTWGPFTVYTSQLSTPDGRYHGPQQDQAQGILEREPQSEAWLRMLQSLWPDVTPGSQLTFVLKGKQGQFWYRASAAEKSFTPLGPSQSAAFSTNFLAIWLDPRTQYPELRQQLIGGEK